MRILLLILLLLPDYVIGSQQTLIGGRVVNPGEYPELVYISNGRGRCSATIVGPQVILTAAHCVKDGGSVTPVSFVLDQTLYSAKCKHHPKDIIGTQTYHCTCPIQ